MLKKTVFYLVLAALLALALSACGSGTPEASPTPAGDAGLGKEAYMTTCIACHGPNAEGMPNLGKDLTTSEFVRSKTNQELVEFFKVGRPASDPLNTTGVDMPPRGGNPALTDEDLLNIAAFIRSIQK
ncbi:MAG TPA: cytochrome c [Anaerolineales bacterium]|nr:cytochrome c [Anaerolineales bacterium]